MLLVPDWLSVVWLVRQMSTKNALLGFYVACAAACNCFDEGALAHKCAWWSFALVMNAHIVGFFIKLPVLRKATEISLVRHFILTMAFGFLHWAPLQQEQEDEKAT